MYIVTGLVRRGGYRTNISKPMTLEDADNFQRQLSADMNKAIPRYKWVSDLWIELYNKDVIK